MDDWTTDQYSAPVQQVYHGYPRARETKSYEEQYLLEQQNIPVLHGCNKRSCASAYMNAHGDRVDHNDRGVPILEFFGGKNNDDYVLVLLFIFFVFLCVCLRSVMSISNKLDILMATNRYNSG